MFQECGYPFILDGGVERVLYGTVCVVSADNLGSLALGGFKESCTATRCCRHCMTNQSDAKSKVCLTIILKQIVNCHHFHSLQKASSY